MSVRFPVLEPSAERDLDPRPMIVGGVAPTDSALHPSQEHNPLRHLRETADGPAGNISPHRNMPSIPYPASVRLHTPRDVLYPHGQLPARPYLSEQLGQEASPRRLRQLISCYPCRERKLKCNGQKPCQQCVRRKSHRGCEYARGVRRRGKGKKVQIGEESGSEELSGEDVPEAGDGVSSIGSDIVRPEAGSEGEFPRRRSSPLTAEMDTEMADGERVGDIKQEAGPSTGFEKLSSTRVPS